MSTSSIQSNFAYSKCIISSFRAKRAKTHTIKASCEQLRWAKSVPNAIKLRSSSIEARQKSDRILRSFRLTRLDICATATATSSEPPSQGVAAYSSAVWKFLRPHTIRGTILGSFAIVTTALLENPSAITWSLVPRAFMGLIALLCGNGYIVGINQIYDEDIDKINKPFLPVASGELTKNQAWVLCAILAAGGLAIVATLFDLLIAQLYSFGLFLGTIYSVPPLRLKQSAVAAFMIIATVRGFLLSFGVYHATRAALGLAFKWSPQIMFITCFVTVFATVIAITKDLPDTEGDRQGGITTFSTKYGERAVAVVGSGLLLVCYFGAIGAAIKYASLFNAPVMIGAHAIAAVATIYSTWKLDSDKYTQEAIQTFYRFIW
eukprot:CAMPEP_0196586668 /NCGR_PEP_ID=MMETSP1081-20130531/55154_1 /TAXON_ID=36882 /ORGANISM="Pyramimonas amylifera, Strain CCMP720" /LENGTH=376 /DNA_ID=CAMNT_0041908627 /DNA_START=31 /DNA_END=1158 /DNA_ORIENTATION=+